jgi:hypothetical protein
MEGIGGELAPLSRVWKEARSFTPWLLAMIALGAVLRFHQLTESNLWMDEIVMLEEAGARRYRLIAQQVHWMHLRPVEWMLATFGQSVFVLRFWSALMGTLAVPVLALWGRLAFGTMGGIGSGILAATAPFLVLYAQDANYYGGMTLHVAVLLLASTLVLRGAAWSGLSMMVIIGAVGYFNHPIYILPWGIVAGTTLLLTILLPALRARLIAIQPKEWAARPLLPLLVVGGLAATVVLRGELARIGGFISLTGGRLTNVTATPGFVSGLLSHLLVNFLRPAPWEQFLLFGPLMVIGSGVFLAFRDARRQLTTEWVGTVAICTALPVVSIPVLFAINVERAFYERYYLFLVPAFIGLVSACIPLVERLTAKRMKPLVMIAPVLVINLYGLGRLYMTNTENYHAAVPILREEGRGRRIVVPHRNDLVQARHFVEQADLPTKAPMLHSLFEHGARDRFAMPYHIARGGGPEGLLLSAWREIRADRFYGMVGGSHDLLVRGVSRMGADYDVEIYRWPSGVAPLFPGLAPGRFVKPEAYRAVDSGAWKLGDGSTVTLRAGEEIGADRFTEARPVMEGARVLNWWDSIAWPLHAHSAIIPDEDGSLLRLERDDTLEFAVHQPEAMEMELTIPARGRLHSDPLLARNSGPIPPGMVYSISVNGMHHSLYRLEASEPQRLLRIPIDLPEGNHVISIHGTVPRLDYTPFFPWHFSGVSWGVRSGQTASIPWAVEFSPGWSTPPDFGPAGQKLAAPWISSGNGTAEVDATVLGLDGKAVIRLSGLEAIGSKGAHTLLSPPIPVRAGTLLKCGYYLRVEGLENVEMNSAMLLIGENGQPLGGLRPVVGPNVRGTMPESIWARREMLVPIPEGVLGVCIGLQVFPIQRPFHVAEHSTVYLSTFFTSATTLPSVIPVAIK